MGIGWLIVVALVVAVVQSVWFGRFSLAKVDYSRSFNTTSCYVGDPVEMVETITNAKPLPVPWIRLESSIHAGLRFQVSQDMEIREGQMFQYHKSVFSMRPFTRIRRRHRIVCRQRGVYRLESVSMSGGDLLGVRTKTKTLNLDAMLTVYPQIIDPSDLPLPKDSWQGDVTVRRWIVDDPFLVSGVRDYRAGDALNRISWKATAKTGELQVYKTDFTSDHRLMVLLNVEVSEKMWDVVTEPELIEKGISYAATLVAYAVSQGMEAGFAHNAYVTDSKEKPELYEPAGGHEHMLAVMESMACIELKLRLPFYTIMEHACDTAAERCDFVLVTAHVSDPIAEQIERMKDRGHGVQVLLLEHDEQVRGETAL